MCIHTPYFHTIYLGSPYNTPHKLLGSLLRVPPKALRFGKQRFWDDGRRIALVLFCRSNELLGLAQHFLLQSVVNQAYPPKSPICMSCVLMYAYIYIYVCYMRKCICVYICVYVCIYIYVFIYFCICMCVYVYICVYA